jgi:hypothetical protein
VRVGCRQHRPGYGFSCCHQPEYPHLAQPASPSAPPSLQFLGGRRIQRLGLGPRSRLRRPFDRPGLVTGESASMGPTAFACRLLQLQTRRTSTIRERWSLQRDEGRNPLHVLYPWCVLRLRRRANGPQATNSEEATPTPLSPVKAWRRRHNPSIHLDDALRRRLPVALVRWARRPSEGPALLGWLREFPSSATPEHPSSPESRRATRGLETSRLTEPVIDPLSNAPPRRGTPS